MLAAKVMKKVQMHGLLYLENCAKALNCLSANE